MPEPSFRLPASIKNRILSFIRREGLISPDVKRVWLAVSGGPDSIFMLYFFLNFLRDLDIGVLHFNHKTRKETDVEEEFVKKICYRYNIPFLREEYNGNKKDESSLREARYSFFDRILKEDPDSLVATAHTLDDLVETFLFRLFKYGGLYGLIGMKPVRDRYIKPILVVEKRELVNILEENGIEYMKDMSNYSLEFDRNYIRLEIVPVIKKRFPGFYKSISLTYWEIFSTHAEIPYIIEDFKDKGCISNIKGGLLLDKDCFSRYSIEVSIRILQRLLGFEHLNRALYFNLKKGLVGSVNIYSDKSVIISSTSRYIFVSKLDNYHLKCRDRYEFKLLEFSRDDIETDIFKGNRLFLRSDLDRSYFLIRFREDGDCIYLENGCVKLKKFFQSYGIPKAIRDCIPIIVYKGEIIAIGFPVLFSSLPYRLSSRYKVREQDKKVLELVLYRVE